MELPNDIIRKIGGILVQNLNRDIQTPPNQTDAESASCIFNFASSCRAARDSVIESVRDRVMPQNEQILLKRSAAFHTYLDTIEAIFRSQNERVLDANITKSGTLLVTLHHKGRDFQRFKGVLVSSPKFYAAIANAQSMPVSFMGPPVSYEGTLRDAHRTLRVALKNIGNYVGDEHDGEGLRARHTRSGDQDKIGDHITEVTRFFRLWHMSKRYKMHSV